MKKITMQDIADSLNISKVTVSNAFNHNSGVSEGLKNSIFQKARELGYINKKIDSTISHIGILIPSRNVFSGEFAFYTKIVEKISDQCSAINYSSKLLTLSDEDESTLTLPDLEGINILVTIAQLTNEYINLLKTLTIPKIMVDSYRCPFTMDSIFYDNYLHGYQVTSHLIGKGHTDIGFIGDIRSSASRMDRYHGFKKAIIEHNLVYRPETYIAENLHDYYYNQEINLPEVLPTAYVCHSDKCAYVFMMHLKSQGIKVPEDISIISFDNIEITKQEGFLSTVNISTDDLAIATVKMIKWRLNNLGKSIRINSLHGNIIERKSVRSI